MNQNMSITFGVYLWEKICVNYFILKNNPECMTVAWQQMLTGQYWLVTHGKSRDVRLTNHDGTFQMMM